MRTTIAATTVLVSLLGLGACKDDKETPKDAPPATGDGAVDSPSGTDAPVLPACANPVNGTTISFHTIGNIGGSAVLATSPPGDPRLFVIDQSGLVRLFKDETLVTDPFLDLSSDSGGPVLFGGENGLLGLAFDPHYATNGTFYVFYTQRGDASTAQRDVLTRCQVSTANPDVADQTTCTNVLAIDDFASNHNGGMIEFGADGYLYIGTGDGGNGGDPNRNGQNTHALLAKFLRLDVAHPANGKEYSIPSDNPFANGTDGAPEVWLYGVRNPWRWSFDRANGDLWIGDVGQNGIEEVDVLKAGQQAGKNLGWSMYEADKCCGTNAQDHCAQSTPYQTCSPTGIFMPQDERQHSTGWAAIIGGQVYRGSCYPDLVGTYFYTDNQKAALASATLNGDGSLTIHDLPTSVPASPASLHADSRGELYLTTTNGDVAHLEVTP